MTPIWCAKCATRLHATDSTLCAECAPKTSVPGTIPRAPGTGPNLAAGSGGEAGPVAGQLALDLSPLVQPDYEPRASIEERFAQFHEQNPHVLVALETLAADYLAAGRERIGIGMLFEVLRYQSGIRTVGDQFRLNNDYRALYVRLVVERHPEWADAFETRARRAAA